MADISPISRGRSLLSSIPAKLRAFICQRCESTRTSITPPESGTDFAFVERRLEHLEHLIKQRLPENPDKESIPPPAEATESLPLYDDAPRTATHASTPNPSSIAEATVDQAHKQALSALFTDNGLMNEDHWPDLWVATPSWSELLVRLLLHYPPVSHEPNIPLDDLDQWLRHATDDRMQLILPKVHDRWDPDLHQRIPVEKDRWPLNTIHRIRRIGFRDTDQVVLKARVEVVA